MSEYYYDYRDYTAEIIGDKSATESEKIMKLESIINLLDRDLFEAQGAIYMERNKYTISSQQREKMLDMYYDAAERHERAAKRGSSHESEYRAERAAIGKILDILEIETEY